MGRPEKPIDWNVVDQLIISQNTLAEIAGYFGLYPSTFGDRFKENHGEYFTTYASALYSKGRSLIKQKRFEKAIKDGNIQMLTKLGEIYLDEDKEANKGIKMSDILEKIAESKQKIE